TKVDHPAARRLVRARVEILAVEIREQNVAVLRVPGNECLRLLGREHEAHAEDDRALERLVGVRSKAVGLSAYGAGNRQEWRDAGHWRVIENVLAGPGSAADPDVGDFQI